MNVTLKSTKDYGEFALYDDNRIITAQSINKLVAAIEKKDLLSCFPIVVYKRGGVLYITDGQRRFLAAKQLGKRVYYIINNQCTKEDIPYINCSQDAWKAQDYLHSYCIKAQHSNTGAFKDYIRLSNFIKTYSFSIANSLIMLVGYDGSDTAAMFKNGQLKIDNYPMACKIAECVLDLKPYHSNWKGKFIVRAMSKIVRHKEYDHTNMIKKLTVRHESLLYWSSMNQYVVNLQKIYNYNKKNKVIFIKT